MTLKRLPEIWGPPLNGLQPFIARVFALLRGSGKIPYERLKRDEPCSGPFTLELHDEMGEKLRAEGRQFCSTTDRPRRCGWLDLPHIKYSVTVNVTTQLYMTKADVIRCLRRNPSLHALPPSRRTHRPSLRHQPGRNQTCVRGIRRMARWPSRQSLHQGRSCNAACLNADKRRPRGHAGNSTQCRPDHNNPWVSS